MTSESIKARGNIPSAAGAMKAGDDPESSHEAAAKGDLAAHKGSAGVSNSTGRGSTVMSKEQKEGKDPIGRHIAEEQESHTDEGERVKRVDTGSV
ncbi:MAG: hypothetical protein JWN73_2682 [Betaproteobacteria bacterium]|nr:hypothetical protein [Betaproteobacteria bacterium]